MPSIKVQQELDKYYTNKDVAKQCYNTFINTVNLSQNNLFFIEPSAGDGSFLPLFDDYVAFDILPQHSNIKKLDFLQDNIEPYLNTEKNIVFLGNPPFGKRSKLAIEFLNKSLTYSKYVGFIVPIQFKKWSVQSKIKHDAQLILDENLPRNSFLLNGKPYDIRCCFQIWSTDRTSQPNLRISNKPAISHPDFEMWQYNRTQLAEKYFDYDWDFAVPRQGYLDYSKKVFNKSDCNKKHQWIFFKAKNKQILEKLLSIDFHLLSQNNTGIPGFGKHDVISHYLKNSK